jgi:hypothetical protein
MEATLLFIGLFGPNLDHSQNTRDEQGGTNQFKGLNLLNSPEPLKQLCCPYSKDYFFFY